jgi:phosphoribosylglycinamide formyltransferase-1
MIRVAFLISGGGSNMEALVHDVSGDHPARAALVLSNNPDAGGLARARALGVPTQVIDHRDFAGDRHAFEDAIEQKLSCANVDLVCLAGFMRVLTEKFVSRWQGKILNIHPSLLPKYPGLNTHARAIAAGDNEAGCTVHEVTAKLDSGPMLGQVRVPIKTDDTPDLLAARVLTMEHRLYPAVLRRFCAGDHTPVCLSATADASIKTERAN